MTIKNRRTVSIQPYPVSTLVSRMEFTEWTDRAQIRPRVVTSIVRTWENGDQHRCRLCDKCCVNEAGVCAVLVMNGEGVPGHEVELYRLEAQTDVEPARPRLMIAAE
jgi:hypothetical protein